MRARSGKTVVGPTAMDDVGNVANESPATDEGERRSNQGAGINAVIMTAASDAAVCERLLTDRDGFLESIKASLDAEELELLRAMPNDDLEKMIRACRVDRKTRKRIIVLVSTVGVAAALVAVIQILNQVSDWVGDTIQSCLGIRFEQ